VQVTKNVYTAKNTLAMKFHVYDRYSIGFWVKRWHVAQTLFEMNAWETYSGLKILLRIPPLVHVKDLIQCICFEILHGEKIEDCSPSFLIFW